MTSDDAIKETFYTHMDTVLRSVPFKDRIFLNNNNNNFLTKDEV